MKNAIISFAVVLFTTNLFPVFDQISYAQGTDACSINPQGIVCNALPASGDVFEIRNSRDSCDLMVFSIVDPDEGSARTGYAGWVWASSNPFVHCVQVLHLDRYRISGRL